MKARCWAISTASGPPAFVFGVVAQFFYVGAQVGVWSYMIRYAQAEVPGMGEKAAAAMLSPRWSAVRRPVHWHGPDERDQSLALMGAVPRSMCCLTRSG
jgi:hypothetical protein